MMRGRFRMPRRMVGSGMTFYAGRPFLPRQRGAGAVTRKLRYAFDRAKSFALAEASRAIKGSSPMGLLQTVMKAKKAVTIAKDNPTTAAKNVLSSVIKHGVKNAADVLTKKATPAQAIRRTARSAVNDIFDDGNKVAEKPKSTRKRRQTSKSSSGKGGKRRKVVRRVVRKKKKDIFD